MSVALVPLRRAPIRAVLLVAASAALGMPAQSLPAQVSVPSVSLGFGVDTVSADVRGIVRTLREYFALPQPSRTPTMLWSAREQRGRALYDNTTEAYQGFPATIVEVVPESPANDLYVVRTLFARYDSARSVGRPARIPRDAARSQSAISSGNSFNARSTVANAVPGARRRQFPSPISVPPSTTRFCPVMKAPPGASNRSSGPSRSSGVPCPTSCS